jgi:hypothetical protein
MKKILLLLFLISCAGKVPDWYINTQGNTDEMLYGVGSAASKEQAVEEALSNLKQQVYTSVSSSKFIQDLVLNQQVASEYLNNIKLKTPNIPVANYKITRLEKEGDTFYAMIEVQRKTLGENIYEIIDSKTEEFNSKFELFYNTLDYVKKVSIIDELYEQCIKHLEIERFYASLGYLYPGNICGKIIKTKYNLASEYPIQLVNSNVKLLPVIVNIFAKKFNIVPESSHVISYKTDVKTETLNNDNYITGIKISIMQYNVAKKYEIQCVGSSSVSAEESIDIAIKSCIERSEKEKFEEFFPQ